MKLWSYVSSKKFLLNSKYIKTKHNQKLKTKFFGPFLVLHLVGKHAYKLEFLKKWRIHYVFHMSLFEQNITRKEPVDDENVEELDAGNKREGEYKLEAIRNSAVYARESKWGHLPSLYYLVFWKGYPKEENTWEPALTVQHLKKLISLFHKDHFDNPTATSPTINTTPLMARLAVKPAGLLKQKRKQATRRVKKRGRWCDKEEAMKRNLSLCGSRARRWRVAGDLSPWHKEHWRAYMVVVRVLKNYTAPYSDQVSHHPSLFSHHKLRFFLFFFINNIYGLSIFLPHFFIKV